ncbi:MAG: 4-hydroxy-tetrahydrodipicolinate reductase, partial [Candidatus Omnitrophica bacterium]|nr:4-hydroxy-tetrahydrodipicolinate reductase [Candidatus Omnitrophota bacterium]
RIKMIKICVSGSKGKMGSRIIALAKNDSAFRISGEFDIGVEPASFIELSDCLIEFTTPEATIAHLALCEKYKKAMVIGTTGLSDDEKNKIKEASRKIPIVFSSNMSIGVNALFKLVENTARLLGPDYTVRIKEAHHVHKKDAPSGTAKTLAQIIKDVNGDIDIPIESIREDEIVGDHIITFESPWDKIELTHSAKTRDIFAKGALEAVRFVVGKPARLYTMQEVLGI